MFYQNTSVYHFVKFRMFWFRATYRIKPSHVRKLLAFYQVTEYVDHQFVKLSYT